MGDGGQATSADIYQMRHMSFDSNANAYLLGANKVRKINRATGIITLYGGKALFNLKKMLFFCVRHIFNCFSQELVCTTQWQGLMLQRLPPSSPSHSTHSLIASVCTQSVVFF
jgi:hypothetical protein